MDEKEIVIDSCYVIGTCLLYKNYIDRILLDRIQSELSPYYEVDLSETKVASSIEEWKDFFRLSKEGNIILTKEGVCNKSLIRYLFADALEPEIYNRLLDAILNVKKDMSSKTKVLKFPK